ncbi:tetratricopeptide repeat protein [Hymenobacter tenuis]
MTLPAFDLRPYLEELERFADGQMTPAEQEAFEVRLEQDATLYQAYQAYEQLAADLRWVAGHETLHQRLLALDLRLDQRQAALGRIRRRQRRTQQRWGLLGLAAGIVLVLLWMILRPTAPNAEASWTRYYVPEVGLSDDVVQETQRPLLAEAMRYYRDGHYAPALHSLRRISSSSLGQDTLMYYNGIFLLSQDKPEQIKAAQPFLRRVAMQSGSGLARRARYHLGMAYWRNQQITAARNTLRSVANDPQNPYQEAARQLLRSDALPQE